MSLRKCAGCGCTDLNACTDPETGGPCYWVENAAPDLDICSVCAAIAMLEMERADEVDSFFAQRDEQPRVQLYSEGEANAVIRSMRAGGGM